MPLNLICGIIELFFFLLVELLFNSTDLFSEKRKFVVFLEVATWKSPESKTKFIRYVENLTLLVCSQIREV